MKIRLLTFQVYPEFTLYITKYGDNGLSYSEIELKNILNIINSILQTFG